MQLSLSREKKMCALLTSNFWFSYSRELLSHLKLIIIKVKDSLPSYSVLTHTLGYQNLETKYFQWYQEPMIHKYKNGEAQSIV